MSVFIYHPTNKIAVMLKEFFEEEAFMYANRAYLDQEIKDRMTKAGLDIWQNMYVHIGSMSAPALHDIVNANMKIDLENPIHKQIVHHFKTKSPWSFVKVLNGPNSFVVGYCNSDPSVPFLMGAVQQAQSGLIDTSFVPRA